MGNTQSRVFGGISVLAVLGILWKMRRDRKKRKAAAASGTSTTSDDKTKNLCSHSHAKQLSDFGSENEHLSGADSPVNHEQEDSSSDCWTCYVLSQAGDIPFEITIDVSHDFVCFTAATYEHWYLPLNTHKFLVRGPPEIHSATS